jgi:hypothetical protein
MNKEFLEKKKNISRPMGQFPAQRPKAGPSRRRGYRRGGAMVGWRIVGDVAAFLGSEGARWPPTTLEKLL